MITRGTPFGDGYNDGLENVPSQEGAYPFGKERDKYADGHRIGCEDRLAGALEPMEPLS